MTVLRAGAIVLFGLAIAAGPACGDPQNVLLGDIVSGANSTDGGDGASDASPCVAGVAPPRLLAPLSTARATHRRPNLTWQLAASTEGAHVELCKDKACAQVLETIDATGTTGAPATDLPPGAVFWRAFGSKGKNVGCAPSTTWEIFVGARSAPVNSSWGSVLDVNEDGYADAIVGSSGAYNATDPPNVGGVEQATLFLGGKSGLSSTPVLTITGSERGLGQAVADAGDVNGDGYADVLVGTGETSTLLFLGGASGLGATPSATLPYGPQTSSGAVGWTYLLAGAGDTNGDGYADVVIGDPQAQAVRVFLGRAGGLQSTPSATLTGAGAGVTSGMNFGVALASAGDVNGDGYGDLIVGAAPSGNVSELDFRQTYVYQGSPNGLGSTPASSPTTPQGSPFSLLVPMGVGDVNGDGYTDVTSVGQPANAPVDWATTFLFEGSGGGVVRNPASACTLQASSMTWYGYGTASADVNSDGYRDVIVGASLLANAYVYMGGPSGLSATAAATLAGGSQGRFAGSISGADFDADGYDDVAIVDVGRVFVFPGSPAGLSTAPSLVAPTGGAYSSFHLAAGSP
jgi:hypothetical protein